MSSFSRRDFLTTSSLALAGATLGAARGAHAAHAAHAAPRLVPMHSRQPVASLLPDMVDPETLRALALAGVDAATHAGASYADVRVGDTRKWRIDWSMPDLMPLPYSDIFLQYGFGVRVRVGSAWGFAFGVDPTPDGVAHAARTAVATARGMARVSGTPDATVSVPVVKGEWKSPFEIDPFTISPDAHAKMLGAFIDAAQRVRYGNVYALQFYWIGETRVFASSEGSLTTQHTMRSLPKVDVYAKSRLRVAGIRLPVPGFVPASVGFECMMGSAAQERIKATTEEAAQLMNYPEADADVGRYDAIIDGAILGEILATTVMQALDLGRALGQDADGAGTSFLAPVDEIVGQQLFSPQLSVVADRSLPYFGAAKWDDEGVATETFPVIEKGRVVDYFTTRFTAPTLSTWYAKRGHPMRAKGSAVAWAPTTSPVGAGSQLIVAPGTSGPTLEAMLKQLTNGVLLRGVSDWSVSSDQQLSGGSFSPQMLFEVKKGQITRRLLGGMAQFRTKSFWKDITMMGDSTTVQSRAHIDWRGETYAKAVQPVLSPAARVSSLDMLQIGRLFT